jgi:ABC-type sugar transport system substrate-binding protein
MRKSIGVCLVVAVIFTMIMGCSNEKTNSKTTTSAAGTAQTTSITTTNTDSGNKKVYKIAFIIKSLQSVLWINMGKAAEQAGADYDNINVDVLAPQTPMNIDEQIQLVEQAITNKVDCIIVAPCDSTGIVPVIKKANNAGIMVITPNTKANGGDIRCFVGVENYDIGYDLGTKFCRKLNGRGNVLLLEGKAGVSTSEERVAGFKDAIKKYPDVKLLNSQPTDWDRAKAMTIMENWLQIYDKIDGVMSLTKDTGLGAIEAMKAAGRNKNILSMTFDIDDETREAIKNGDLYATGNQNEMSQGYLAVTAARMALMGYQIPKTMILPITFVTADDLK